jgi:hypothetical protein
MMFPVATFQEILRFLLLLETQKHGYSLHRSWGWATATDIGEEVMKPDVPEQLKRLVKTGHISRTDVRLRDASRAVWAYRITQLGADQLPPGATRVAIPAIPSAPDRRSYVPTGVRVLLFVLRHVVRSSEIGDPPWRTSIELTELLRSTPKLRRHGSVFEHHDLQWAVRNGFVARRDADRRGTLAYLITPTGAGLRYLGWRGPVPGSGRRLQVGPGLDAPPHRRTSSAPTAARPPTRGGGGNSLGSGN